MIDPIDNDIGRAVIYKSHGRENEEGIITSFNDTCVFVRYGVDKHSKGTHRRDLEWAQWQKEQLSS